MEIVIMESSQQADQQYRFHLLGLTHLPVSEEYMGCAFTQKIVKMSKMLLSLGHEVFLYGSEGSDAPCTEHIQTHTLADIRREWGVGDNRTPIGYDWKRDGFKHDFNEEKPTDATIKFRSNTIRAINERKKDDDFLLIMQGYYHKEIDDAVGLEMTLEPGIGYRGSYAKYRAFESAYLQNFTYGSEHPRQSIDGNYYDRVIPNYFDGKDFPFQPEKEDYFLYIGRMIKRKGVYVALETAKAVGAKLILAGQGELPIGNYPDAEVIGYVGPERRAELMGKAKAVFVPTEYLEAFGGVHVEAMLCGTPCITSDFGVFPGTVVNGANGFRGNTLQDFVDAARSVGDLDPYIVRTYGERYLMDNVKWEFQKWFDDIYRVYLNQKDRSVKAWSYYE
jgi:glycosyltransferase involved in cell wall biosynthesis